jgi:hypothetical protein
VIEFETPPRNLELLRKLIRKATMDKFHIQSLSDLAPELELIELREIAKSWQEDGLGRMHEVTVLDVRHVSFSLNQKAINALDDADRQTMIGRLKMVSRSDWIAVAAVIISLIALFKT